MTDGQRKGDDPIGQAQAILFDKDGTLLDFTAMWGCWTDTALRHFEAALSERGLRLERGEIPSIWGTEQDGEGRTIDYDRRGPLAMGTMDELYAILAWQGYAAGLSWAEAKVIVRDCLRSADAELEQVRPAKLLPGVQDLLDNGRKAGIPMAVVTADETDSALKHLRWLGIDTYFAAVVGTDQAERGKPYPDLCLLACERLGVAPEHAIVIGDTEGDMAMARAAGVRLKIGIGEASALPSADRTVLSLSELRTERPNESRVTE
ncbi:haloacid dehalogenase [Saccharibacillus sp. O23]|uniref:HAD family hydrolase n=1 Tax=Saccharibacillus sp. O23 TaxID=2009338 RepID=UPI000B4E1F75|nr:HAD family phosphatase [Saccharibacillus sp. O23]OWR29903.1 haloacid dehalogenase [Saccharibacillus sp. O23]